MKTKGKFYRILLRRRVTVSLVIILQVVLLVFFVVNTSRFSYWIEYGLTFLSFIVAIKVVGKSVNGSFKLIWVVLILAFPVVGGLLYLWFNYQQSTKKFKKRLAVLEEGTKAMLSMPGEFFDIAAGVAPECMNQISYLQKYAGYPVYTGTRTEYLSPGEAKFERLLEILKKAEKYIFLEYFSIKEGIMWNSVLEILIEKAKKGVDIRIIYDDVGCFLMFPKDYPKKMEEYGIKCVVFNPIRPVFATVQNYRDHRKIAIADGVTAITGGINLSDEYINAVEKYGHWKDAAVLLEGPGVWSFTVIFLRMWAMCTGVDENFAEFYPDFGKAQEPEPEGLVQPYADSPLDNEQVGENVYLQMIGNAREYVYINTPYLVPGDSMLSALSLAAKSGVDVRLVTPSYPDKVYVHIVTRSYYRELIMAGVKIYEYSEGFIHSKTTIADGKVATVGTSNIDFRSFYLSFECGVWLYNCGAVAEIYKDFMETLNRCRRMSENEFEYKWYHRILQDILRLFAPVL